MSGIPNLARETGRDYGPLGFMGVYKILLRNSWAIVVTYWYTKTWTRTSSSKKAIAFYGSTSIKKLHVFINEVLVIVSFFYLIKYSQKIVCSVKKLFREYVSKFRIYVRILFRNIIKWTKVYGEGFIIQYRL